MIHPYEVTLTVPFVGYAVYFCKELWNDFISNWIIVIILLGFPLSFPFPNLDYTYFFAYSSCKSCFLFCFIVMNVLLLSIYMTCVIEPLNTWTLFCHSYCWSMLSCLEGEGLAAWCALLTTLDYIYIVHAWNICSRFAPCEGELVRCYCTAVTAHVQDGRCRKPLPGFKRVGTSASMLLITNYMQSN